MPKKAAKRAAAMGIAIGMAVTNVLTLPVFAEDVLTFEAVANKTAVAAGEEVTVKVNIKKNPGVAVWRIRLGYDSDAFEIVKARGATVKAEIYNEEWEEYEEVSESVEISTPDETTGEYENPFGAIWGHVKYGHNFTNTGTVVTVVFKAKEDIENKNYQFNLFYDDVTDFMLHDETVIPVAFAEPANVTGQETESTVAVTGVTVSPATVSLEKGKTQQLTPTVLPNNATDKTVSYSSDKPGVATVSSTGLVTAVGEGTATITVKTTDGEKTATCVVTVTHKHSMEKIAAKAPTCTTAGNNEYYHCTDCNKYFKDSEGKTETTVAAETLAATAHANMQTIAAKAATCTEAGNNKYYYCPDCKKYFKDAAGKTETTVAAETIAATAHSKMQTIAAKAATCTEAGNNKYYYCPDCKKYFKDAEGKTETTVAAETIAATAHSNMQTIAAKAATCTEDGNNKYYYCPDCKKYFKDAEGKTETTVAAETIKASHNFSTEWSSDAEYHWKDCTVGCGTIIEKAAHSGGEATCVSKAHCEICGEEYGDVDPTNHKGTTYLVGAKDPQVGVKGYTGDVYCSDCHQKISDGEDIDALLPVAVTGVEVTPASVSLEKEGTQQLTVNVLPANAYDKSVTFTSDKPGVATVSSTGLITALGEGTATITVKTTDGEKTATCAVTVTHKHTMQKINAVAPTCTAAGNNEYYYCTDCKKYYKDAQGKTETTVAAETLDAINHANMQTIAANPATCTEAGNNKYYYCPDCKKYFKDAEGTTETTVAAETISATGHTHMQEITAKPATCTEAGNNKYYYCSDCNKYFKDAEGKTETTVEAETVAATAHANMQKINAVAPTCTEAGNNEYYYCPDCKKYFKDAQGKTETTVTAETLDAINHANMQTIDAKPATCTEAGNNKYYYCPDCKKYFKDAEGTTETTVAAETISATGHTHMQEIEAKPATCTEAGNNKYYYCPDCKKYFKDAEGKTETTVEAETIAATAHANMQKIDAVAPTCTEAGNNEYYYCPDCKKYFKDAQGKTETTVAAETLDAINHANVQEIAAKDPSCTENGNIKYYYCPDCKKYFTDAELTNETTLDDVTIPATGHNNMQEIEAKPATCTEDGNNKYYYCPDCKKYFKDAEGKTETTPDDEIIKAGHTLPDEWTSDENEHWKVCTVVGCGSIVDKAAHSGGEATCVSKAHCEVCGTEYGEIDPDNHKGDTYLVGAKEAQIGVEGYTGDVYCSDCKKMIEEGKVIDALKEEDTDSSDSSSDTEGDVSDNSFDTSESSDSDSVSDSNDSSSSGTDSNTSSQADSSSSSSADSSKANSSGTSSAANNNGTSTNPATGAASALALVTLAALGGVVVAKRKK